MGVAFCMERPISNASSVAVSDSPTVRNASSFAVADSRRSVMQAPLRLQIAVRSVMQAPLRLQIAVRSVMQAPLLLQIAVPDVKEAAKGADILVFVLPHQFVRGVCNQLKGTLKEGTIAVTLIKVGSFYTL